MKGFLYFAFQNLCCLSNFQNINNKTWNRIIIPIIIIIITLCNHLVI